MKTQFMLDARRWLLSALLLAGLVYSVLGLTLTTNHVYASSCDCNEAFEDATYICGVAHLQVTGFTCPVGSGQDQFSFRCGNSQDFSTFPCSY